MDLSNTIRDGQKPARGLTISGVRENGIAAEMEMEAGDIILQVDGNNVDDILDLQYFTAEDEFVLTIEKQNGEIWDLNICIEPDEDLGIEMCAAGRDGLAKCLNNCIFCFVHQLPAGMRASLYDKDDDYRLSVTQGTYITLTNLAAEDFQRIIKYHISPLFISVHAWEPDVRQRLMRSKRAGKLPEQIEILAGAGITLHCQIVVVPGYNQGKILEDTVHNLAANYPAVQSIGVVPAGLTKFRQGLTKIHPVGCSEAEEILDSGMIWQKKFRERTGKNLVYFSDEFYVLAGREFPAAAAYDDFAQLENGIGMAAKLDAEIRACLPYWPESIPERRVHIITGVSAYEFMLKLAGKLKHTAGLKISVHKIYNDFFGRTVTVAGLLTAQDIGAQLEDLNGEYFLIPQVMLKADEDIFLDGYNVAWLENKLNGKAVIIVNNGQALLEGIFGGQLEDRESE